MSFLPDWWRREPVRFGAAVVIFVNSVIALVVSFGWLPIEADQLALLYLVVLNGENLPKAERASRRLAKDDQLSVMPPLKGG